MCKVHLSQKLKKGYRYENQFWNPGFTDWFRQLCGYQYLYYEILCYLVSSYSTFFSNYLKNSTQILRPHKENSKVSFNDTLLNFGHCSMETGQQKSGFTFFST